MATEKSTCRLLLRAKLVRGDRTIVSHTLEVSESIVFVQTDEEAFIGDEVMVDFSFPGLVEAFSLETQVIARHVAAPGRCGGWTLGFVFYSEDERRRLRSLLEQIGEASFQRRHEAYRVLLVEDNELTRAAFSLGAARFFGDGACRVALDIVESGEDAWARLKDESYDLAIVDYFLPVTSGDRLIARLRHDPDLARLPVFAISGGGDEARQATLTAGADLFLPKPIVLRDLFFTLSQLTRASAATTAEPGARPTA